MEFRRDKLAILYFDLVDSAQWVELSLQQKSKVKDHVHDFFLEAVKNHNHLDVSEQGFRGDDGIACFREEPDCVAAGIEFLENLPEMIRRCPSIESFTLNPRIIAFSDVISGSNPCSYSGTHLESILSAERSFGNTGAFRVVGNDLFSQIDADLKRRFSSLPEQIQGKDKTPYAVFEFNKRHIAENIRRRHLPPYLQKYQDQLNKFYSNNLAARNAITHSLISRAMAGEELLTKKTFMQGVLDSCRVYLELTVSSSLPRDETWKFKLAFWAPIQDELRIVAYSYPQHVPCRCYDQNLGVKIGENIVGQCFEKKTPVILQTDSPIYVPIHQFRDRLIKAVAAIPVINPVDNSISGVLSIDTRVERYFSGKQEEMPYLMKLIRSFTNNLVLAEKLATI